MTTLSTWIRDWDTIARLSPDQIYLLPGKPKFLGYIPQRFRVYRGQVIAGQAGYLVDIDKHIFSDVVSVLRNIDPTLASGSVTSFRLGQVKDYVQLDPHPKYRECHSRTSMPGKRTKLRKRGIRLSNCGKDHFQNEGRQLKWKFNVMAFSAKERKLVNELVKRFAAARS